MIETWDSVREALDRAHGAGRTVRVWLRDDDCVAVTPALDRLAAVCAGVGLPILLAVIPEPAEPGLAPWIGRHPSVVPCQHGFAHRNHAAPSGRARELGGRPPGAVLDELARGRAGLRELFGGALSDVLVPPWNRIDEAVIPRLPRAGYSALSCFGPPPAASPIPRLDSDLDIVDWRHGRVGRPLADLSGKIATILDRQDRLGILTHHLAHDGSAWAALEAMLHRLAAHPAVRFADAASLLA